MKKHLIVLSLAFPLLCFSQVQLKEKIETAANKVESKSIEWRRDFHQNPELGNNEYRTAKKIADHLRALGIEVKENVGKTGVVGILKGAKPGKCIALRADIDALPIVEKNDLPFISKVNQLIAGLKLVLCMLVDTTHMLQCL